MTTQAHELDVLDVSKAFVGTRALLPTSFAVKKGEFVTILGPSGCGKSTLLRIITGITEPSGGRILLRDRDITRLPPERRDIAIVFQSYALFPHMSVADNILFGLKMKRVPKEERRRRFDQVVAICGLESLVTRSPRQLSGGQQQRVALARALVVQPALLLLDEPLSNLDAKLRETLREELMALHKRTGSTTLYVTHDQSEAMSMSDRIIVMKDGQVVESGAPRSLYMRPRQRFTALFFGHTNIVPVDVDGDRARLPWGGAVALIEKASGRGEISLRPECLSLVADPAGPGVVDAAVFMGADVHYTVRIGDHLLRVRRGSAAPLAEGTRVSVTVDAPVSLLAAEPPGAADATVEAR
ncbi:ABC transporter ATP-binding protein [Pleomorphomonas sp. JP5]|uniref:ABC transporter ATP-binding protein n=1 Tax=Pleomorphomonas sp. JP5 TaxID=2942998 RepID=UPI002043CB59|nr:ATP-binding cassette domain-containing protein [Pleomorphomonas sp. JP5]MCM5559869.1 ABC transporter ATP-binding protein [Pleomorphomonas sp. JP5]